MLYVNLNQDELSSSRGPGGIFFVPYPKETIKRSGNESSNSLIFFASALESVISLGLTNGGYLSVQEKIIVQKRRNRLSNCLILV